MFYLLSRILGPVAHPLGIFVLLAAPALLLRKLRRLPRARRWLMIVACAQLWLMATGGVADLLLYPLEEAYQRPADLPRDVGAVVVLTGMLRAPRAGSYELTEAADRIVEGVRLMRQLPRAKLLIVGGLPRHPEAEVLRRLALDLGVGPDRIWTDRHSRNTRENAVNGAKLLSGIRARALLLTSASHMPRAVACFHKVGVSPIPWPVDYRRQFWGVTTLLPTLSALKRTARALHEYAGLVVYSIVDFI